MAADSRIVPAEVISVADRLVGSLSLVQASLLGAPLGLATLLLLAPPRLVVVPYKVLLVLLIAVICLPLAVRWQGRLIVSWLVVGQRYWARPRRWSLRPASDCPTKTSGGGR